jgi:hypothetical protein
MHCMLTFSINMMYVLSNSNILLDMVHIGHYFKMNIQQGALFDCRKKEGKNASVS